MNGEEAVTAVRKRLTKMSENKNVPMYKLIMLDFSMPLLTGPQATRKIRGMLKQKGYSCDEVLICAVTEYSEISKQREAEEAGMNSFLVKPVFKSHMHRVLIEAGLME